MVVWPFTRKPKVAKQTKKKQEELPDSVIISRLRQKTTRLEKLLGDMVMLRRQELPNTNPKPINSYYNVLDSKIESNWKSLSTTLDDTFGLWNGLSSQAKKIPGIVKLHTHLMECQKALALEVNDDLFPISRMIYEYDLANNTISQTRLSRNQSLAKRFERGMRRLVQDGKDL